MKTKHTLFLLLALTLIASLAGCGKSEDGAENGTNLDRALALTPGDASRLYFTDWALIKDYEGFPDLSSQNTMDERMSFMRAFIGSATEQIPPRQAAASGYGFNRFPNHAETWAWDNTDLVWEATLEIETAPPAYVLQFPADFDFGPLLALFDERGFSQSTYQGVTVYSHEMDLAAEWIRKSEFGILNTALLEEDQRLVLSSSLATVQAILDAQAGEAPSLADSASAQAIADRLGQAFAAIIAVGPASCQTFSGDPLQAFAGQEISDEQLAQLKALLEEGPTLHLYTALGVGYRYDGDELTGLIVMHYPSADDAQADSEPRRQIAQEGLSLAARQPYTEVLFTVQQATVEGSDLVWQVAPVDDMPRRLFDMVLRGDMLFARCP
jgi:hypothetical protein